MSETSVLREQQGLHVVVYAGDNKILIAMSLQDGEINEQDKNLAGFAIWRTAKGKTTALANRITFDAQQVDPKAPKWTPSDQAPFQKFRWIDVPPDGFGSPPPYRVQAIYFVGQTRQLKPGQEVELTIDPAKKLH